MRSAWLVDNIRCELGFHYFYKYFIGFLYKYLGSLTMIVSVDQLIIKKLSKLNSIEMKILNVIACNLNWIPIKLK
jgi:hypothetical protein